MESAASLARWRNCQHVSSAISKSGCNQYQSPDGVLGDPQDVALTEAIINYELCCSFKNARVAMSDTLSASATCYQFDDDHERQHGFRLPADPY